MSSLPEMYAQDITFEHKLQATHVTDTSKADGLDSNMSLTTGSFA